MASDVDISNMALSHIGEDALVVALSPPDGSVQSAHCARFWPIARAELQEVFEWSFCEARHGTLAQVESLLDNWTFAYTLPADCLKVRKLMADGELDERTSRPYVLLGRTLFTNDENPILVYTKLETDPTKFSPAFTACASYLLASYLAGPILKKPSVGQAWYDLAMQRGRAAAAVNANASTGEEHEAPAGWMSKR
jgi:hypothetical protein